MFKYLYQTNDKEKNNELVNMINSGLKEEKKIEDPVSIVEIVEDILKFNKKKSTRTRHKNTNTKPNA